MAQAPGTNELGIGPLTADELVTEGWLNQLLDTPAYTPLAAKNNWDPTRSTYNTNARTLRTARAGMKKTAASTTAAPVPYHMLFTGDSTLIGYNGSTYQYEYSIPRQCGKALARAIGVEHTNGLQAAVTTVNAVPDNVTLSGNWTLAGSSYPHFFTGQGVGSYTMVFLDPGTSVEFYISNLSGSGLTYSLDGGTAVAISPTGAATSQKITAGTNLPKIIHTLTISGATSGQFVFLQALRCWDPLVPQVQTHNLAIGGTKANDPSNANYNWSDSTTTSGGGGLGYSMNQVWSASGLTANVQIISAGNNDHNSSIATANIITGLTTMKNYRSGVATIFVRPPRVSGSNSSTFNDLCSASFTLADNTDSMLLDWNDLGQDRTNVQADGLLGPDNNHPVNGEQVGVGRVLCDMLSPPRTSNPVDTTNLIVVTSTGGIARPYTWYRITTAPTFTLPASPPDGAWVKFENTNAAGGSSVPINAVSGQSIEGSGSLILGAGDKITLSYRARDTTWYMERETYLATGGTLPRRDSNGRLAVADPALSGEAANKNYVDTKRLTALSNPATQVASTANTLVYATPPLTFAANTLVVGDTFRFFLALTNTATAQACTLALKVGTAGTIADATAQTTTLGSGTAAAAGGRYECIVSVRALGASGTIACYMQYLNASGTAGLSSTAAVGNYAAATVNTTGVLSFGATFGSTVANIVSCQEAVAEIVRKA